MFNKIFASLVFLSASLIAFAQPANDDPCNATPLAVNSGCTFSNQTTTAATASVGVPAPGCASYNGGDVWFSVTVPANGNLIFDSNTGSLTDGGMAIYRGTCNSLTLIECDDDDSANGAMPLINSTGLIPGETIWIRFWRFGGNNNANSNYSFQICVYSTTPPPPLTNDEPCDALPIAVNSSCNFTTYSNAGASASVGAPAPGCASYSGGDVWFSATVPASGNLIFDSNTGVITDGGMAIYRGSCNALTLIECDDDDSPNGLFMPFINASGLIPGETIWIRFWEYGNDNNGTFDLCVYDINFVPNCTSPICTSPTPDDCNSACSLGILSTPPACPATDVVVDNFCLSNVGATAENPYTYLTNCQGVIGNDMASPAIDVWYSFTATSTSATFSVTGLNSPNIALYQGVNCTNSFGLGCNTGSAGFVSLTYGSLFIGQSYLIRVSGGDTLDVGDFNLGITSFNNCDDCLLSSSLVVNPPPVNGVYAGGQTVEFCYTVESWTTTAVDWFHGVSPSFGAGWDLSTLGLPVMGLVAGTGTYL